MLLDFDNIKMVFPNHRVRTIRVCKSTVSNRVNWIMPMGYSFSEALEKAQSPDFKNMVVAPINK